MEKEILIEALNVKGLGTSHLESGAKVEVFGGLPGDRLLIELGKKRRRVFRGSVKEILTPSPTRIAPRCAHATECGGCSWQHQTYEAQLVTKQAVIEKLFPGVSVNPILSCSDPWEYRNKMEFSFSQNKAGERFLGLIQAGTKGRVLQLSECHLMNPWATRILKAMTQWWEESGLLAYFMPRDEGTLRNLTLREGKRTGHKMIILTVSGNPAFAPSQKDLTSFLETIRQTLPDDAHVSVFLRIHQQIKGSPTQFFEMHLSGPDYIYEKLEVSGKSLTFKISPTSFFQPNTYQAELLYTTALNLITTSSPELIYDLYCGTGTLGLALASKAQKVIGIEINPHAIFDAKSNLELNQTSNVTFLCGDVGKELELLASASSLKPDLVVVDPPRTGLLPQAITHLLKCAPKEILYISCNPVTQAENIKVLCENGYRIAQLQPVDQFPHTPHIENIALLQHFP